MSQGPGSAVRFVGLGALLVILVLLWIFPDQVFPHPGTNDAIVLADIQLPLLLIELAGVAVAFFIFRGTSQVAVRVGLSVLLMGVAVDLIAGLVVFGNMSNDRFAALIFLPVPLGLAGLVGFVVGIFVMGGLGRPELLVGALYGVGATVLLGIWTLVRGSRDWLLAPYGLDFFLAALVLGVAIVLLTTNARVSAPELPG